MGLAKISSDFSELNQIKYFPESYAEQCDNNRHGHLVRIKDLNDEIFELNKKVDHINKHISYLKDLYAMEINQAAATMMFPSIKEADDLEDEFRKNGFDSKLVKSKVAAVRSLFFNDNIDKFKSIDCINVELDYYSGSATYAVFVFELSDNKLIYIDIPVGGSIMYDRTKEHISGKIGIKYKKFRDDVFIISTYSLERARRRLEDLILKNDVTPFEFPRSYFDLKSDRFNLEYAHSVDNFEEVYKYV